MVHPISGKNVSYNVINEIWYSIIGLSIITVMILLKVRYWKHFLTLLLLAATFKLIQFSPTTSGLKFDFIQIEFMSLFLLVIQMTINNEPLKQLMDKVGISTQEESTENAVNEDDIKLYIKRYQDKNQDELIEIIDNKKYTTAARHAANRLLK
jgi:ribosomal protein L12E/L44/L45/RPP1/RPP2